MLQDTCLSGSDKAAIAIQELIRSVEGNPSPNDYRTYQLTLLEHLKGYISDLEIELDA